MNKKTEIAALTAARCGWYLTEGKPGQLIAINPRNPIEKFTFTGKDWRGPDGKRTEKLRIL